MTVKKTFANTIDYRWFQQANTFSNTMEQFKFILPSRLRKYCRKSWTIFTEEWNSYPSLNSLVHSDWHEIRIKLKRAPQFGDYQSTLRAILNHPLISSLCTKENSTPILASVYFDHNMSHKLLHSYVKALPALLKKFATNKVTAELTQQCSVACGRWTGPVRIMPTT